MIVDFMQVRCTAAISSFHTASVAVPASSPAAAPLLALMLHALLSPRLTDGSVFDMCAQGQEAGVALKKCEKPKWPLNEVSGSRAFCVLFGCDLCRGGVSCLVWVLKPYALRFLSILAVLSVDRRHHKPPLRGGGASGRRGQVAGSARPLTAR